jgi:prevent-host-death family protein
MTHEFTIAEARNHLSEVVRLAEDEGVVELTRRGKPVALVVSTGEFARLCSRPREPFSFLAELRAAYDVDQNGLEPGDLDAVRDRDPGRAVHL